MKQHERNAQRTAEERSAAMSRVGIALMSALDETRIEETACELTGAEFAALRLGPVNDEGERLVPAEGGRFHRAGGAGVTAEQEALFRRMPLSGEGLLAPIFRHGVPVRVADALAHLPQPEQTRATGQQNRDAARQAAFDYAHGQLSKEGLRSMGVPRGHPVVRSFLGVPLLDRTGEVRGGLLLGHSEPEQFTQADEDMLVGLAAQAAVALENAQKERREFIVSASPLRQPSRTTGPLRKHEQPAESVAGAVVVWHDATEARRLLLERRAHAETEARRALLQTVIDELPSGVYLVRGPDARLVLANRAAAAVWGAPWRQGQPMSEFLAANGIRVFHVDGRPFAPEEFATLRAVRTGEAVRHHQEIIRHPDGTSLPVLVNAVALDLRALSGSSTDEGHGAAAEPGAIVVHQDVTALKEAERLKDEFIGIAAHELRSPLAVIKGFAQMLIIQTARGKGSDLAEWQMEAIQDIDQATNRLV